MKIGYEKREGRGRKKRKYKEEEEEGVEVHYNNPHFSNLRLPYHAQ